MAAHFSPELFEFLTDLKGHNDRDWFKKNKTRYESTVKSPALEFIRDFATPLSRISAHLVADDRPVGGSLFRIHRDVRFAKDKSPYKTHTGIHFRHEAAKNAYGPGFYLHLEPGASFVGAGIWHPDRETLSQIREAIDENGAGWKRAAHGKRFTRTFELSGDALKRAPKPYDPDHPLIEDLKRKDFIGVTQIDDGMVTRSDFVKRFATLCGDGVPLMKFLCEAVDVPF